MKVGDLVELSAYGKKLKMFKKQRGLVGVVVDISGAPIFSHVHVQWCGAINTSNRGGVSSHRLTRKDLRIAK